MSVTYMSDVSHFLDIALREIARGFAVHPLWPGQKNPLTKNGWHDASKDEAQIREWWSRWPNANVGVACGPSGIAVLDCDYGLADYAEVAGWLRKTGIPITYTVRTGRRPGFGFQMYFTGTVPDVGLWELEGCSGQIKSAGGYVLAAGCLHPSGERYEAFIHSPLEPLNAVVRNLKTSQKHKDPAPGEPFKKLSVGEGQHDYMTRIAGKLRNTGLDKDGLLAALIDACPNWCDPPLSEKDLAHIADSISKKPLPAPEPAIIIGGKSADVPATPAEPRPHPHTRFHTQDQTVNAPPITFLIDQILQVEGITGIAAPVRERKTILSLNITAALLTGKPLFGKFEVTRRPERVIYLCPEMSLGPFSTRLKKLNLVEYVGKTLFYRTLSITGERMELNDPDILELLPDSVVVLDTAIRFLRGKENDSDSIRVFADELFALLRGGALSVLMLHHSSKSNGAGSSDYMTLENALRGSGDIGAFLSACWGTKLQDPEHPYKSLSFIDNLKQRDFETKPFEVTCNENFEMGFVEQPEGTEVKLKSRGGGNSVKEGHEIAMAILKANPKASAPETAKLLEAAGVKRGVSWIKERRAEMLQANDGKLPGAN